MLGFASFARERVLGSAMAHDPAEGVGITLVDIGSDPSYLVAEARIESRFMADTISADLASSALLYRYDEAGVVRGVAGTLAPAIPSYAREMFEEDPVQHHLIRLGKHPPVMN